MMELFFITLVLPMFGIFGALLGSIAKNFAIGKMAGKGVPPAPVGGVLPTIAQLFIQRAKAKRRQQAGSATTPAEGAPTGQPPDTASLHSAVAGQNQTAGGGTAPSQDVASEFFRRLLEGASGSSWAGRQIFGQEPSQRMRGVAGGGGIFAQVIRELMRRRMGGG